jgi:hypothetical protein
MVVLCGVSLLLLLLLLIDLVALLVGLDHLLGLIDVEDFLVAPVCVLHEDAVLLAVRHGDVGSWSVLWGYLRLLVTLSLRKVAVRLVRHLLLEDAHVWVEEAMLLLLLRLSFEVVAIIVDLSEHGFELRIVLGASVVLVDWEELLVELRLLR